MQRENSISSPTGSETGRVNTKINLQVALWNQQTQLGELLDSSTRFHSPNSSDRSPDAAWIAQQRWYHLTPEQRETFLPLCPDFAVEILSEGDRRLRYQIRIISYTMSLRAIRSVQKCKGIP